LEDGNKSKNKNEKKGDFGEQAQDVSPHVRRGLVDGNVCENRKRERERERERERWENAYVGDLVHASYPAISSI